MLIDKHCWNIGAFGDFKCLSSWCDPKIVKLSDPKNISEMNVYDFESYVGSLACEGIERIFLYYSGCSHNGEGTNFPELKFADRSLKQPEIRDILSGRGFSMVVFGYDSGNEPKPNLVTRAGGSPVNSNYVNGIWDYTGSLYFCGSPKGATAWANVYSGGIFTRKFHKVIKNHEGNWLSALDTITNKRIIAVDMILEPQIEATDFVSSKRPEFSLWSATDDSD